MQRNSALELNNKNQKTNHKQIIMTEIKNPKNDKDFMNYDSQMKEQEGEEYVEHLHHFRCYFCRKWWSIGDAPKKNEWYCPWCGKYQEFRSKNYES